MLVVCSDDLFLLSAASEASFNDRAATRTWRLGGFDFRVEVFLRLKGHLPTPAKKGTFLKETFLKETFLKETFLLVPQHLSAASVRHAPSSCLRLLEGRGGQLQGDRGPSRAAMSQSIGSGSGGLPSPRVIINLSQVL
ncbi:hypothetical protein PISL3812_10029 [Talaromyces islandicus]|uniref:Uncharacterized protein n=1 Tax=Talaromyces islandicus TaxID=28573 RepID=A0A0U1MD44_TALIS|nr:hypothetical protein PISL3812_10029 [Talaromyces islandicus]